MHLEFIENICSNLPGATSDIKWGHDLVFSIGEKMFCVCSTDPPLRISFKVKDDEFEEMSVREGFQPAPYMARAKWVLLDKPEKLTKKEWEEFIKQSYELVKEKLPKKVRESLSRK
jgi:predicted DNA-binding protein (MmcQ/YjbR family)